MSSDHSELNDAVEKLTDNVAGLSTNDNRDEKQDVIFPHIEKLQELYELLHVLKTDRRLENDREIKNNRFYRLYKAIWKLLSEGCLFTGLSYDGIESCASKEKKNSFLAKLSINDNKNEVCATEVKREETDEDFFVPPKARDDISKEKPGEDGKTGVTPASLSDSSDLRNLRSNSSAASETNKTPGEDDHYPDDIIPVAGSSTGNQPPPATDGNASRTPAAQNDVISFRCIQGLRLKLCNLLHFLRTTVGEFRSRRREFKDIYFYELYETISELFLQGHYAGFEERYKGLIIASIEPKDLKNEKKDSWLVLIEDSIAEYLDVKGQFFTPTNQFSNSKTLTTCFKAKSFTMRSASFTESRLFLSEPQKSCKDTKNIIYGIRCKLCLAPVATHSNISYVGKVGNGKKASVHERHTTYQKNNEVYTNMGEHADTVHRSVLNFHDMMEMIYLPVGDWGIVNSIHLYSWECFWQFFCRVRECRGGWCIASPNKNVEKVYIKAV